MEQTKKHPVLVFGLGLVAGYLVYKYRKEIVSSTTRAVDAGKDFVLQQKDLLPEGDLNINIKGVQDMAERKGIMQPYIFPYIGYFQLINAVDKFVVYDDVAFINKGWINRNNVLVGGKASMFTIPLVGASQNRLIREIEIDNLAIWGKNRRDSRFSSDNRPVQRSILTILLVLLASGMG